MTILGLDIGSVHIRAVSAQYSGDELKITGIGQAQSQGIKKGSITNIEEASKSIKKACEQVAIVSGMHFDKVIVSVSGTYTTSVDSTGIITISKSSGTGDANIGINQISRALKMAMHQAAVPPNCEKLHVLPYNFKVESQNDIEDPLGMCGSRLEVSTHIVLVQNGTLANLKKAIENAGISVDNFVLSGYASAIATLTKDEKELGVILIDMGGETCDIVAHYGNSIRANEFVSVGSAHITMDLSQGLKTSMQWAEKVKLKYKELKMQGSDIVEFPVRANENEMNEVSLSVLEKIMYARAEETLMILAKTIESEIFDKLNLKNSIGAGVVLTGGMTKLEGLQDLASAVFASLGLPVRLAKPRELSGLVEVLRDPQNSCAIGLCLYGAGYFTPYEIDSNAKMRYKGEVDSFGENLQNLQKEYGEKQDEKDAKVQKQKPQISDLKIDESEIKVNFLSSWWRKLGDLF